ncbi:MAG: hypothetical protein U9Q21_02585 [Candidatus Auribacterota bacterium]|nr:hypothetical protein [Candidatus Auribacterota bacterium]
MPIYKDLFIYCPVLFIPENVIDWYNEYAYIKKFPGGAKPYGEQSAKFIDAIDIYENALMKFIPLYKGKPSGGPQ